MPRHTSASPALVKPRDANPEFTGERACNTTRYGRKGPTFGLHDHTAAIERNGKPGIRIGQGYACDENWFLDHPARRIYLRPDLPGELTFGDGRMGWWVAILRSKHDIMWNRAAFAFLSSPSQLWDEPPTDAETLAVVGRFSPRAMLNVALLSIGYRFLPEIGFQFASFDRGAGADL